MDVVAITLAVPLGLMAGGFVTMLVDRIPDATPLGIRSRCPACEQRLTVAESLPVVGWWLVRGRCRHCDEPVTPAYPVVELLTAALVVLVAARHGAEWTILPPLVLVVALVALSMIDLYVYRLPDRLVFPAVGVSALAMVVAAIGIDRPSALSRAAVGAIGYFLFLFVAHLISPRGMGFGDVKLALLLGLHLGWTAGSTYVGWSPVFRLILSALLLGSLLGVVIGLLVAMVRGRGHDAVPDPEAVDGQPGRLLQHSFPFGPALAAGTLVAVLFPDALI